MKVWWPPDVSHGHHWVTPSWGGIARNVRRSHTSSWLGDPLLRSTRHFAHLCFLLLQLLCLQMALLSCPLTSYLSLLHSLHFDLFQLKISFHLLPWGSVFHCHNCLLWFPNEWFRLIQIQTFCWNSSVVSHLYFWFELDWICKGSRVLSSPGGYNFWHQGVWVFFVTFFYFEAIRQDKTSKCQNVWGSGLSGGSQKPRDEVKQNSTFMLMKLPTKLAH